MKILPFKELKENPNYTELCETSYNSLVTAYKELPKYIKGRECQMRTYGAINNHSIGADIHDCGTVHCLVGIFPLFIPTMQSDYIRIRYKVMKFSFKKYQNRIIPGVCIGAIIYHSMWCYLFDPIWSCWQNNFEQGIERIGIVLSGKYKKDWKFTKTNEI